MDRSQMPARRILSLFRMAGVPGLCIAILFLMLPWLSATGAFAGAGHAPASAGGTLANSHDAARVSAEVVLLVLALAGLAVAAILLTPMVQRRRPTRAIETRETQAERSRVYILQAALDAMNQGVLVVAGDQTITVINDRAVSLLGLPANAAGSRLCLAEADLPTAASFRPQMLAPALLGTKTYDCKTPEGLTLEIDARVMPGGSHIISCTDVTERNRARQDLAKTTATPECARQAAILAMMSHEIRTPLNGIRRLGRTRSSISPSSRGTGNMSMR